MILTLQKFNGEVISQQDFLNRYNQEFEARAQREGEAFMAQSDSPEFVTATSSKHHLIE